MSQRQATIYTEPGGLRALMENLLGKLHLDLVCCFQHVPQSGLVSRCPMVGVLPHVHSWALVSALPVPDGVLEPREQAAGAGGGMLTQASGFYS